MARENKLLQEIMTVEHYIDYKNNLVELTDQLITDLYYQDLYDLEDLLHLKKIGAYWHPKRQVIIMI